MKGIWNFAAPLMAVLLTASGCSAVQSEALAAGGTPTTVTAGATTASGGIGSSISQGTQPVNPSNLPPALAALHPQPGSQACRRPSLGVDLLLNDQMRKNGSFDPATVRLILDGQDVTSQSEMQQTLNFPASRASIRYSPGTDLSLGPHRVAITFPSLGGTATHEWNFVAVDKTCP